MRLKVLLEWSNNFLRELAIMQSDSHHTQRAYAADLAQFFSYWSKAKAFPNAKNPWTVRFLLDPPNNTLSQKEILSAARTTQSSWVKKKKSTRNRQSATLRSFFRFLEKHGLVDEALSTQIRLPKIEKRLPVFFSVDEVLAVIKQAKAQSQKDPRPLALLLLLYGAGLRLSEACELNWIAVGSGDLRILGKGNKERLVAIPSLVREVLRALTKTGPFVFGKTPLATQVGYRWIRKLGEEAGLTKRLHPHALRHSYATHLLQGGMDLRLLQEILGHTSLATTERYIHLQIHDLARTMERLHPLGHGNKTKA